MKESIKDIRAKKLKVSDLNRDELLYMISEVGSVEVAKMYKVKPTTFNSLTKKTLDTFDPLPYVPVPESDIPIHLTDGAWMDSDERKWYKNYTCRNGNN